MVLSVLAARGPPVSVMSQLLAIGPVRIPISSSMFCIFAIVKRTIRAGGHPDGYLRTTDQLQRAPFLTANPQTAVSLLFHFWLHFPILKLSIPRTMKS